METSSGTAGHEDILLFTLQLVHPPPPRGGENLCFGSPMPPSSSPRAQPHRHSPCHETLAGGTWVGTGRPVKYVTQH